MAFWPELPVPVLVLYREFYGLMLLATLLRLTPHWRRFFLGEKWGGYGQSSPGVDVVQNPFCAPLVGIVWLGCGVALMLDWHVTIAAGLNLLIARYFFLFMRWRGVQRGYGAPGYMTYWFGLALFLLEATARHAPRLQSLALLVLQVDFALIIFSAAFYKFRSGYARGEGMDYGLCNPMWSYWPRVFRSLPPGHWFFSGLSQLAWSSQMLSALLMLFPPTRFWGGLLVLLTYLFLVTQIRLGFLAELMCLGGLLFCVQGSLGGDTLARWFATWGSPHSPPLTTGSETLQTVAQAFLWLYLLALPLCHAGLFTNFYGRRRLPAPLQWLLERWTNFFGIILWRVFSVDHLNFHVAIYQRDPATGTRQLISEWQNPFNLRFWNVGEAIAVTTLFTTLKYYPSNDHVFRDRVLRYARTLPCCPGHALDFDYLSIRKEGGRYLDRTLCVYHVDPRENTIGITVLDASASPKSAAAGSPVHEASHPGTYAPKPA